MVGVVPAIFLTTPTTGTCYGGIPTLIDEAEKFPALRVEARARSNERRSYARGRGVACEDQLSGGHRAAAVRSVPSRACHAFVIL